MVEKKALDEDKQLLIKKISLRAAKSNPNLDYSDCYTITLLYYLTQYERYNVNFMPPKYEKTITLLHKNPTSSYLHYRNNIIYSKDPYAIAIKQAEIDELGGDPRCPW